MYEKTPSVTARLRPLRLAWMAHDLAKETLSGNAYVARSATQHANSLRDGQVLRKPLPQLKNLIA
jgi:hypothetical protein